MHLLDNQGDRNKNRTASSPLKKVEPGKKTQDSEGKDSNLEEGMSQPPPSPEIPKNLASEKQELKNVSGGSASTADSTSDNLEKKPGITDSHQMQGGSTLSHQTKSSKSDPSGSTASEGKGTCKVMYINNH